MDVVSENITDIDSALQDTELERRGYLAARQVINLVHKIDDDGNAVQVREVDLRSSTECHFDP